MIKLIYFAALVDMFGCASEELAAPLPPDVRALLALLQQRGGPWERVFGQSSVHMTVNKQFAELETPLKDGDEVAFISAGM
jgi:sulfur-carrier protein